MKSICTQLINRYGLGLELKQEHLHNVGFLNYILRQVSSRCQPHEHCVIVVDALDEVDLSAYREGINPLHLPHLLPEHIYFVVTLRNDERYMPPHILCAMEKCIIDTRSANNLADVADYIRSWTTDESMMAYIRSHHLTPEEFVGLMVDKSAGNFMYLRYVLPAIQNANYQSLTSIPSGLEQYYESHWRRMRGQDEGAWFAYKLKVLMTIAALGQPLSVEVIAYYAEVERTLVQQVLSEWQQFFQPEPALFGGKYVTQYSLYHASFYDFINAKQEIQEERVNLEQTRHAITDLMLRDAKNLGG
jgi:hypothetical protein